MTLKNKNEQQQQLKPDRGVLPSKVPSLGVFDFSILKKNDYRSVISITFISDIVFHLVAISTLNKSND